MPLVTLISTPDSVRAWFPELGELACGWPFALGAMVLARAISLVYRKTLQAWFAKRAGSVNVPACQLVGLLVNSIKRIRVGKISMAKLQPGQWRYLPPDERF